MEYFFKAFRENLPFDETFIKELQRRLTFNTYDERRLQRAYYPPGYELSVSCSQSPIPYNLSGGQKGVF